MAGVTTYIEYQRQDGSTEIGKVVEYSEPMIYIRKKHDDGSHHTLLISLKDKEKYLRDPDYYASSDGRVFTHCLIGVGPYESMEAVIAFYENNLGYTILEIA